MNTYMSLCLSGYVDMYDYYCSVLPRIEIGHGAA